MASNTNTQEPRVHNPVFDRIDKLVRLALSTTHEGEAAAAMGALVRLLKEHKCTNLLDVLESVGVRLNQGRPRPVQQTPDWARSASVVFYGSGTSTSGVTWTAG